MDRALAKSKGRKAFGYWMGPGTCKTAVTLQDAWRAYDAGEIDAVLVIAPNNVKDGWVKWEHMVEVDPVTGERDDDEVNLTLGNVKSRIIKGLWIGGATGQNKKCWAAFEDAINNRHHKLIILSVNYEALLGSQLFEFLTAFCKEYRVMIVADESTRIGKPGSKRTKRATKLAELCAMRRALTGTVILKSPLKYYSQGKFLGLMPWRTFTSYRNHFAIMGGFQGRQVLSYQNEDDLSNLLERDGFRARKEDCLDLPPQVFLKRRVYMEPEQLKAYKSMREDFFAIVDGTEITASIVLAQITRLQQITGGYLNKDGKVFELVPPERNPKLIMAHDLMEDAPGSVVVWCRFREEIEGLKKLLDPKSYFEFHGGVPEKDRSGIKSAFKRKERPFIIGTESTGGIGINQFLVADTVVHVSSDFDTEKRVQADDRNHRMGSQIHEKITYYDILVPSTVDTKIHRVLRGDSQLSSKILREQWREWI